MGTTGSFLVRKGVTSAVPERRDSSGSRRTGLDSVSMALGVGTEIWLERRKFPDAAHYRVRARYLGEDEHGVWAGARPGHVVQKGDNESFQGQQTVVWCVPRYNWYLVHYLYGHPNLDIYIDIATPAVWNERGARLIDLDLDVVVWNEGHEGRVELVDEDEFDLHRIELDYPQELVEGARRAGGDVLSRAAAGAAPFSMTTAEPWVEALAGLPD